MAEKESEKKHEDKHYEHHHEHKPESHESHTHSHKKKRNPTEKIRENPWIVSTVVLAILAIILIATGGGTSGGKVLSEQQAGDTLVGFLNQQTDGGVEYVSAEDLGTIYQITVNYQDQDIPVYMTKDGKYYLQGVVDLEEQAANTNTNTNAQPQTPADIPKADVPEVELFVMSYCPYGTQAEKGILPVLNLLGDKIDFNLRFVYYAMHPTQGEVEENLRQYCIQKEQEDKLNAYLECFLTEGDSEGCLTSTGVNKAKLTTCTKAADTEFEITKNLEDKSSWLSGNYPLFNIDKALNEQYGVGGSPTLVINGEQVSSGRSPAAYLATICASFTEGKVPAECDTEVSTETLSPGFGWTTQSGAAASAQCG
jgi:glutaredoxin